MKVRELKEILARAYDDNEVVIRVNNPGGYVCPDGAVVEIDRAFARGIDWHSHDTILHPKYSLDVHDIESWAHRGSESDRKDY